MTGGPHRFRMLAVGAAVASLIAGLAFFTSGGRPAGVAPPDAPLRAEEEPGDIRPDAPLLPATPSPPVGESLAATEPAAAALETKLAEVEALRRERRFDALEEMAVGKADLRVRVRALEALAEVYGEEARPVLLARVGSADEDPRVRAEAARLVGRTGPRAVEALRTLLESPLPVKVREGAVMGLAETGTREGSALALDLATDPAHPLRLAAGNALGRMFAPEAARQLALHLATEGEERPRRLDPAQRASACASIGVSRIPDGVEPLARLLRSDRSPAVRAAAAHALGVLGREEAIEPVSAARSDPSPEVAREARIAWERLSHLR